MKKTIEITKETHLAKKSVHFNEDIQKVKKRTTAPSK